MSAIAVPFTIFVSSRVKVTVNLLVYKSWFEQRDYSARPLLCSRVSMRRLVHLCDESLCALSTSPATRSRARRRGVYALAGRKLLSRRQTCDPGTRERL